MKYVYKVRYPLDSAQLLLQVSLWLTSPVTTDGIVGSAGEFLEFKCKILSNKYTLPK